MNDYEPTEMVGGDTVEWRKSHAVYKASDGWALTYYFRGAGAGADVTGTPDGDSWLVSARLDYYPEGQQYGEGKVAWQAWVRKGEEKHLIGQGTVTILPALDFAVNTVYDARTPAERDLDAVRAALVPATAASVMEYEITGANSSRRLRHFSKAELLELEKSLAQRVNAERRNAARAKGAPYFKTIYPR